MKRIWTMFTLFFFLFAFAAAALAADLTIVGTGDGVGVLKSVGEAFAAETGITVDVPPSIGSGGGVKAVGNDENVLGRVAREVKDKEAHYGLSYTPFTKVPTVFYVHNDVMVDNLTTSQVLKIYSGDITNWKAVGGADGRIRVVRREEGDSSLKNLRSSFPGFKDITLTERSKTANKTPEMVDIIQRKEGTIGFGPLDVAIVNGLKYITIDGTDPLSEDYPTFGTIALIYKEKNNNGNVKKFIDFATSEAAASAIGKAGGIPFTNK